MPNALGKKVGPLPAWAWVAGGLLFVGMVWYMRRNAGDSSATAYVDPNATDGSAIGAPSFDAGSPSGSGSLYGSDVTYQGEGTPVGYPPDYPTSGYPLYEYPTSPYMTEPVATPSGGTQTATAQTAPTKQTSFQWGGITWTSKDQTKFRAWLKAHGVSYATWAKNHPKAAMDVFGTMT